MLESILMLGKEMSADKSLIESLVSPLGFSKGKEQVIVRVDYITKDGPPRIEIDVLSTIPDGTDRAAREEFLLEHRWLGNRSGNRSRPFSTTAKADYIGFDTLPCLARALEAMPKGKYPELEQAIGAVWPSFFRHVKGADWALDLSRIPINGALPSDEKLKEFESAFDAEEKPSKKIKGIVSSTISAAAKTLLEKNEVVGLYGVFVDGQEIAVMPGYDNLIEFVMSKQAFLPPDGKPGVCSACGKKTTVSTKCFTNLEFLKAFITDKLTYAWDLDDRNFKSTFPLCEECFEAILKAQRILQSQYSFSVNGGELRFLVLPEFLLTPKEIGEELREKLRTWCSVMRKRIVGLKDFMWLFSLLGADEENLKTILTDFGYDGQAAISFVFYKLGSKGEFRIFDVVKDVVPGRIRDMVGKIGDMAHDFGNTFNVSKRDAACDIKGIYKIIPCRGEGESLLPIVEALLGADTRISYDFLIDRFTELSAMYLHGSFGSSNIVPQGSRGSSGYDKDFAKRLVLATQFLGFLKSSDLLEGTPKMEETTLDLNLDATTADYLEKNGFTRQQTALFLLGMVMERVAYAQAKAGHAKAVLKNLNCHGMSLPEIKDLANSVFEDMVHYKLTEKGQGNAQEIYANMMAAMGSCTEWPLTDVDNVFCILAGYSYGYLAGVERARQFSQRQGGESVTE